MPAVFHAVASPAAATVRRIGAGLVALVNLLQTWSEVARQRHELAMMSDHMLRDIGVSRADVDAENGRRFWDVEPRIRRSH